MNIETIYQKSGEQELINKIEVAKIYTLLFTLNS